MDLGAIILLVVLFFVIGSGGGLWALIRAGRSGHEQARLMRNVQVRLEALEEEVEALRRGVAAEPASAAAGATSEPMSWTGPPPAEPVPPDPTSDDGQLASTATTEAWTGATPKQSAAERTDPKPSFGVAPPDGLPSPDPEPDVAPEPPPAAPAETAGGYDGASRQMVERIRSNSLEKRYFRDFCRG